jgi:signal transduction histidine kinase
LDATTTPLSTALDSEGLAAPPQLVERLMAIARASALEEMASGIAHELNQPLGAIVTFAQAGERILNQPDASLASAREVFQLISKEALGAAEGIRRMRRLFHRDTLDKAPCGIDDVIRELLPVLNLLAKPTGTHLVLELQPDLPKVNIDRLRVQHVVFTLAQNAIEATGLSDGTAVVRIDACGDRYGVEVSVSDSGAGIALAQRPQIFHPFFTTKAQGTGLGLASARAIIEAHEGSIGFAALDAGGTRFWFRVPVCESQ